MNQMYQKLAQCRLWCKLTIVCWAFRSWTSILSRMAVQERLLTMAHRFWHEPLTPTSLGIVENMKSISSMVTAIYQNYGFTKFSQWSLDMIMTPQTIQILIHLTYQTTRERMKKITPKTQWYYPDKEWSQIRLCSEALTFAKDTKLSNMSKPPTPLIGYQHCLKMTTKKVYKLWFTRELPQMVYCI